MKTPTQKATKAHFTCDFGESSDSDAETDEEPEPKYHPESNKFLPEIDQSSSSTATGHSLFAGKPLPSATSPMGDRGDLQDVETNDPDKVLGSHGLDTNTAAFFPLNANPLLSPASGDSTLQDRRSDSSADSFEEQDHLNVRQPAALPGPHPGAPCYAPKRRHPGMTASQQDDKIVALNALLQKYTPTVEKPQDTTGAENETTRPTKKRKSIDAASRNTEARKTSDSSLPALIPSSTISNTKVKTKQSKNSKAIDATNGPQPPKEVGRIATKLNKFGPMFEGWLDGVVKSAVDEMSKHADPQRDIVEVEEVAREWKQANREQMGRLASFLERKGLVELGSVVVPDGGLGGGVDVVRQTPEMGGILGGKRGAMR